MDAVFEERVEIRRVGFFDGVEAGAVDADEEDFLGGLGG
jgi:hypothetical protein